MNDNTSHPSKQLVVIGVTGTNGKTTVTHLIGAALKAAGYHPYVLGTLNSGSIDLSTPVAADIREKMAAHLAQGGTHFIMEVTSEGIDQGRVDGIDFNVKLLTNISQDHLDYHKSFAAYKSVKLGFMADDKAHCIYPQDFNNIVVDFNPRLVGQFNRLNIKAAMAVLDFLAVDKVTVHKALAACSAPRGRMECVAQEGLMKVFIDYAHTPDALDKVLEAGRAVANQQIGRVLLLFGCGGNRDSGKRAKMGLIAARSADHVVLTDDNPRNECSESIISDIVAGFPEHFVDFTQVSNRKSAIRAIINMAEDRDIVILAGKGHENYQIVHSQRLYLNEHEEVAAAMAQRVKAPTFDGELLLA